MRAKRLLVMFWSFLRLNVFSIRTPAKLFEIFVVHGLLFGLSTAVHRNVDNNKVETVHFGG
ncbi:unnamed protein product [Hymenolepis diminuta]|uniref:Uncharacterized protein n=1 Tax=Hymenolepis diminuta TaxID=6216 RepID=A0A564Z1Y6_HYMDI|nr:unnamed protein product [Hymenolepis diminuta]